MCNIHHVKPELCINRVKNMPSSILIVDDEKNTREGLCTVLEDDYDVYLASSAEEAFRVLDSEAIEVVITDLRMAGKSGMSVIDRALKMGAPPSCVMMTAYGDVPTAVEAMKRGAYDFLTKPLNIEQLEIIVKRAINARKVETENKSLHERLDQKYSFEGIVGNSVPLQNVLNQVKQVATAKTTVLLLGETGTGKELIAQMVHQNSPRARKPFVAVHCAAIASNLLESELFGHEKGAFTGANERRIGRFEAADGGTLFLDEIGEIDSATQVKLLRFLETRSFERLGSIKPIQVDIRLVCATHRDLQAMVAKGSFREDLFYRLSVVPIRLPALRERADDIPKLLDHYIHFYSQENGVAPLKIMPDAERVLTAYAWPGNIRELRNFCENIVVMRRGGDLTAYDLDGRFAKTTIDVPVVTVSIGNMDTGHPTAMEHVSRQTSYSMPLAPHSLSREENEKRLMRNALIQSGGNRTKAAEMMGISRRTLHRKLQQWPELDVE